jgi:hypothetical protein
VPWEPRRVGSGSFGFLNADVALPEALHQAKGFLLINLASSKTFRIKGFLPFDLEESAMVR